MKAEWTDKALISQILEYTSISSVPTREKKDLHYPHELETRNQTRVTRTNKQGLTSREKVCR